MKLSNRKQIFSSDRKAIYAAVVSCLAVMNASANPVNPDVVNGTATFTIDGNKLIIANSPNAIINWGSFDIDKGELVRFIQQSATSAVLNRDFSGNPSEILGTLTSNGKVFLINPAGVIFGVGSEINTAGLVASSLSISDDDFKSGKMRFQVQTDNLAPGAVINNGTITTSNAGKVYLIAPSVENNGVISTPSGETILAAGNSVEIVNSKDPLQRVVVKATTDDLNLSQLIAQNGGNVFKVLNTGKIQANSAVVGKDGKIYLRSAGDIVTTSSSQIDAKGTKKTDGGFIQELASNVGFYQGSVNISGKNGGFLETSGHHIDTNSLSIMGDALSLRGKNGDWLIDPANIEIAASGANQCSFSGGSAVCSNDTSVILVSALLSQLNSVDVTIDTSSACPSCTVAGDITVSSSIVTTSTKSLDLIADGSININANVSIGGHLTLDAGNEIKNSTSGTISAKSIDFSAENNVTLDGSVTAKNAFGSLIESASGSVFVNALLKNTAATAGGDIEIAAWDDVQILAGTSSTSGDITVTAGNSGSGGGMILVGNTATTNPFSLSANNGTISLVSDNVSIVNASVVSKNLSTEISNKLTVGDVTATLSSFIDTTNDQQIDASLIDIKAGTGSETVSGKSYIQSRGSQVINITDSGDINLFGSNSTDRTDNSASIILKGTGIQEISGINNLNLVAGLGQGSNAVIEADTSSNQDIHANTIAIIGGSAKDSSAGISVGTISTISADTMLSMIGGNDSSTPNTVGEFSSAFIGSDSHAVNLTLNIGTNLNSGALSINGGSVSGANPGAIIGAIGKDAKITINVTGETTIDASTTSSNTGVLIGTTAGKADVEINANDGINIIGSSDGTGKGKVLIGSQASTSTSELLITTANTAKTISLNNNVMLGFTNLSNAPLGRVTLESDSISQNSGEFSTISANIFNATTDNGTDLHGDNNINTASVVNNNSGNIYLHNHKDMTIGADGIVNQAQTSGGTISLDVIGTLKTGESGIQNNSTGAYGFDIIATGDITTQNGSIFNEGTALSSIESTAGKITVGTGGIESNGNLVLLAASDLTIGSTGGIKSSGSSTFDAGGNLTVGAGGIQSFGNLILNANNIKGSGLIDLDSTYTLTMNAFNNIGSKTSNSYTPVNFNAGNVYAYTDEGQYIILGNRSNTGDIYTVSMMQNNNNSFSTQPATSLTDAILFNYKDLDYAYLYSNAASFTMANSTDVSELRDVYVTAEQSDFFLLGKNLNLYNSSIDAKNTYLTASNSIEMNNSGVGGRFLNTENIYITSNNITLNDSYIKANSNINFNADVASVAGLPGSAGLSNLLAFASNSIIKLESSTDIQAGNNVNILGGSLTVDGSRIEAIGNDVLAAIKNNITINGSSDGGEGLVKGGEEVRLAVGGNLILNTSSDGDWIASIKAESIETIYLDFPNKGKIILDGKTGALSSEADFGDSGLFVDGAVAVVGDTLKIRNGSQVFEADDDNDAVKEIINTTTNEIVKTTKETKIETEKNDSNKVSSKSTTEKFFEEKDNKNSNKKSQPKQCS